MPSLTQGPFPKNRTEFNRSPLLLVGFFLGSFLLLTAVFGPLFSPFDPMDHSFVPMSKPSIHHSLGINDGGQDILSELLLAVQNSVSFAALTGLISLLFGVGIGILSAWYERWLGNILMRIADVLLAIPSVMILILVSSLFRPDPLILSLLLSGLAWPTIARGVRAQTLSVKNRLHILAVRQMGAGPWYVIWRHLVPELFPLYLLGFTAKTRMAILMEASLAYLGLFEPGRKSLGAMISPALKYYYLDVWWYWLMPPVLFLAMLFGSVTFISIAIEGWSDPRLRGMG